MKFGVVISGNFASSESYWLVETEMASRCGTMALVERRLADWYEVASTNRFFLRSTNKELDRKKSAPSKGRATSATTKFHLYALDPKRRDSVRVPYVLIELPLAASTVEPL